MLEAVKRLFTGEEESAIASAQELKPKVLIGVAGFHGVIPECQENFFQFAYRCGRDNPDFDFLLKILIKREQFRYRNNIVDLAIANGCDYVLMLDDDMVIPPDLFKRLKAHNKDVIGCLYYQRGGAYHPVIMKQLNKKDGLKGIEFINHFDPILQQPGLHKINGVIGGGCMLFKTDVFRKIQQPYFWIDGIVGTDVHICNQLMEAKVDIWVDTSIELGHVGVAQIVTSRNIPNYSRVLGEVNEQLWHDLKAYYGMNDIELESAISKASVDSPREDRWKEKPRETWEQIREYYQMPGSWQVLNLAAYNLRYDQARDWAINNLHKAIPARSHVVDYGCGLGYVAVPLAQRDGFKVTAIDIEETETLKFLNWRIKHHKLETIKTCGFLNPLPPDIYPKADAVLMISCFDHLYYPMGALDWASRNTNPGAYLLVDSWRSIPNEDEPQHILKFDPHRVMREFRKRGWQEVPENPILFRKEI